MKTVVVALACALIAPLAFAQTGSKGKTQGASTAETITVTGTIEAAPEAGAAANYQPAKTLIVRQDGSNKPGRYELNGPGHVVNKSGQIVQTAIKPGTRVLVYYTSNGESRLVDHVVVMD